jgi:putative hemin transport protein
MSSTTNVSLRREWKELLSGEPELRERDAARRLGVSEGELIATRLGDGVVRLRNDSPSLFRALNRTGSVLGITRNEAVVSEIRGVYTIPSVLEEDTETASTPEMGPPIDLRILPGLFHEAFAVEVERPKRKLMSVQFFDSAGTALHKAYLMTAQGRKTYAELVGTLAHENQDPMVGFTPRPLAFPGFGEVRKTAPPKPGEPKPGDEPADPGVRESLLSGWESMADPHEFAALLRHHSLTRREAFAIAEGTWTQRLQPTALMDALRQVATESIPMLIFVGNVGCIQIFHGRIKELAEIDSWFNVLDDAFNLHVRMSHIAEGWFVRKPGAGHSVTSLEFLDRAGEVVLRLFGEREQGHAEREDWRSLADGLVHD